MIAVPTTPLVVGFALFVVLVAVVVWMSSSSGASTGRAAIAMNNLRIVSGQPVAGSGSLIVEAVPTDSQTVSFKIQDAAGTTSATRTVTNGGDADQAPSDDLIVTTLDLGTMFESTPESGTGAVYAGDGDSFSIPDQTFDSKRRLTIDADSPIAVVESDTTVQQGQLVKIPYTITDVPQGVSSTGLEIIDSDGNVQLHFTGLDAGEDRVTQFVASSLSPGTYDVKLIAVDEVGHRTTHTREGGLVVEEGTTAESKAESVEIAGSQPVKATGSVVVEASVSTTGETISFKVQDADGTVSATKTVVDGGAEDQATVGGNVRTPLDLGSLFDTAPVSGTGRVYAAGGDSFSIPDQTFDTKTQITIDANAPTATITSGAMAEPDRQTSIGYTVTDDLQELGSIEMKILDRDGNVVKTLTDLQRGESAAAQFEVPADWSPGGYDVKLVAVDEVGHTATDTYQDGLLVMEEIPTASALSVVGDGPLKGTGTATVEADVSVVGADVSFKIQDAAGNVSATKTVTDGETEDQAGTDGVVRTTLDLSALFDSKPESGTGILYAGGGPRFSVSEQTFDTKQQVTIDADRPTAAVESSASARQGQQVQIEYSVTDVPQKVASITMSFVDSEGNVGLSITDLQAGESRAAQFVVPQDLAPGSYDVKLVAVDEAGYQATDTLTDGLTVKK